MMPIQAYLVASHLDDLRREAAASRRASLAAHPDGDTFGSGTPQPPSPIDVRRALARAAVRLSLLADGAAHRLDPCLDEAFGVHRAAGVAGR